MLDNKDASIEDLIKIIKGPDFPLGGIITGIDGMSKPIAQVREKSMLEEKHLLKHERRQRSDNYN
ncbi:MAG: hypothetical protein CM15mP12_2840 [Gammaproteobacteria bacterium]|nr:MAG: hypothetical protein CM15mP12_2840 [Gammaproteobacteria bacterium]